MHHVAFNVGWTWLKLVYVNGGHGTTDHRLAIVLFIAHVYYNWDQEWIKKWLPSLIPRLSPCVNEKKNKLLYCKWRRAGRGLGTRLVAAYNSYYRQTLCTYSCHCTQNFTGGSAKVSEFRAEGSCSGKLHPAGHQIQAECWGGPQETHGNGFHWSECV